MSHGAGSRGAGSRVAGSRTAGGGLPRAGALLLLLLTLGGCASLSQSELHGTYQALVAREQTIQGSGLKPDARREQTDDLTDGFVAVAQDALTLARTSTGVTKVSLSRLVVSASFHAEGRADALALEAAELGTRACAGLSPPEGAPRDCAILLLAPDIIASDAIRAALRDHPPDLAQVEQDRLYVAAVEQKLGAIAALAPSIVVHWQAINGGAGPYRGLAPEARDALGRHVRAAGCRIDNIDTRLAGIAARVPALKPQAEAARAALKPALASFKPFLSSERC
ncbi:hypothetical protein [Aquabacter spiritensis]|uniref:Uncharacterized protein n=1 Tax=Aquabacter spiritensis TaxID=933073 RepID=A0A4R3LVB0_9HYPH|nr:hypothetical protein [Aquabacter spiritensis]TCT02367.1 hypothetical protein EDC64_11310 [Aquabacter spiritensis]